MKKILLFAAFSLVAFLPGHAQKKEILLSTPETSLLLFAPQDGALTLRYFGSRITEAQIPEILSSGLDLDKQAYPVFGTARNEAALVVRHAGGDMSLDVAVEKVEERDEPAAKVVSVTLKDKLYPFRAKVNYRAYKELDVIETWVEISHEEKGNVKLQKAASGYLSFRQGEVWVSHLYGSWGSECTLARERLMPGAKVLSNRDGARNAFTHHPEVMFSLDGAPQENTGRTIGAILCWSGNYELNITTEGPRYHEFYAGIDPIASEYALAPKEVFTTPVLAYTFSEEGLGGVSRNIHRWARKTHIAHGERTRDILLNSWEGVYFKVSQEAMDGMIEDIASLGGELFVMDDGWFGDKYPRDNGKTSLGDWTVAKNKLPNGIGGLIASAEKNGIKFGLWIEPEMTNTESELYEKHPDWIVCPPGRTPICGRGGTQLILDMSNPKVQDFVFGVVDNLMKDNPKIAYMKWDANFSIVNYGSSYLTGDKQSHPYIDYHRGLEKTLQRIRAKYPDLTLQLCASGGGRVNYGLMPYYDEFWTSDDTDAFQRVHIQWGTSYFFPSVAMGSHVSASPNHQTKRVVPIKYRFDVAMSGRLGMEMQPKDMTDAEKEFSKSAIATYKAIRPVVQQGDLYRLISPYDGKPVSSLMYCSADKKQAVMFVYRIKYLLFENMPTFRPAGLDPAKTYRVTELNRVEKTALSFEGKEFPGRFLMEQGFEMSVPGEYGSRVLKFEAVD